MAIYRDEKQNITKFKNTGGLTVVRHSKRKD